jgi:hypothetical protein
MKLFTEESPRFRKFAFYGPPGSGKTWVGMTSPQPILYLLSEYQGMEHIRGACRYYGVPFPSLLFMETKRDYFNVIQAFKGNRTEPFRVMDNGEEVLSMETWPQTVVIDSLTDALDRIERELLKEAPPQKSKKTNLPEKTFSFWNALTDRCKLFIKQFRDIDANIVFLCLRKDKDADSRSSRYTGPDLPTKSLGEVLSAAVNICAQMKRFEAQKVDEYGETVLDDKKQVVMDYHYALCTRGEVHETIKSDIKLKTHEKPDVANIIRILDEEVRDASQ